MATTAAARAVHRRAVVIDLVCPLANVESALDEWIRGGATAIGPTVAADDSCGAAMQSIGVYRDPKGLEVPSKLPALTRALLARGYGRQDVEKILGGNLLRVFGRVWK